MNVPTKLPRLHSIKKVAEHFDVCTKTVQRWIDKGELRCYRLGGRVLISEEDLLAHLSKHHR